MTKRHQISDISLNIYKERRDVLSIKKKILENVSDPDKYWESLSLFFKCQISKQEFETRMNKFLNTNELKHLHNSMLRMIIFNAHFSSTPPPGVKIPKPRCKAKSENNNSNIPKPTRTKVKKTSFQTFLAADMRHLPNGNQAFERIRFMFFIKKENLKIEPEVAPVLREKLYQFINVLLKQCLTLSRTPSSIEENARIELFHLIHLYKNGSLLSKVMSPSLIQKYAPLINNS